MISARIIVPGLVCLALAACSDGPSEFASLTNPAPCPQASVLFDSARIVDFHGAEELENVGFTGEILGVRSLCEYADGEPIEADLEIEFAFGRGPAAEGRVHAYPFFVAVTRLNQAVIAKEIYATEADFGDAEIVYGRDRVQRITIPRANDDVGGENFEIIVGFELNQDQLAFNRSGVRFRPEVGEFEAPSN